MDDKARVHVGNAAEKLLHDALDAGGALEARSRRIAIDAVPEGLEIVRAIVEAEVDAVEAIADDDLAEAHKVVVREALKERDLAHNVQGKAILLAIHAHHLERDDITRQRIIRLVW